MEDDSAIRSLVSALLNHIADITTVSSLEQARGCLTQRAFDLSIVDVLLPDGNGLDLIAAYSGGESPLGEVIVLTQVHVPEEQRGEIRAIVEKGPRLGDKIVALVEQWVRDKNARPVIKQPHNKE